MMKGIITILIAFIVFCSCQDDETYFDVTLSKESLSFRPFYGGAIMYYKLPANDDILYIRARYQNAYGEEIVTTGSYATDSLILSGFAEAREDVEAAITLCHRNGEESKPLMVTFKTQDSAPIAFFDYVKVKPSWDGFSVSYDLPGGMKGLVHILYIGTNPETQQLDTILMQSVAFTAGKETYAYELKQKAPQHTIVLRTEDYAGNRVKQEIYEDVPSYDAVKLTAEQLEFLDPNHVSIEDEEAMMGSAYLFDGDTKGEACWQLANEYFKTFLAGPDAVGAPFIIDMKEQKLPAMVKIYGMLHVREYGTGGLWDLLKPYYIKMPCLVRVYGSDDKDDENSWEEIGSFSQAADTPYTSRWSQKVFSIFEYRLTSLAELQNADPACLSVSFPSDGKNFRYLKIVVEKTFSIIPDKYPVFGGENPNKYVSFHELEVYVKK